jgi:hypothetical protein
MIKIMSILTLLCFSNYSMAKNVIKELDIEKLLKLTNKSEVHQALLKLKKDNLSFNKSLLSENSYKPDVYTYSNVLELLLEKIPSNLNQIPTCSELKESMASDYKVPWTELDEPTHKIWPAFEILCKK